ncbi:formylglycine-generating enzyme family protein, partial [Planctomycetota bacterium]|nr:formylglycine-generating enzyme family protein [Planctomycetota bacterium]
FCILLLPYSFQEFESSTIHLLCEPGYEVLIDHGDMRLSTVEEGGVVYRNLPAGKHVVTVRKEGLLTESFIVELDVDDSYAREVVLKQRSSILRIKTIPRDCEITCSCLQLSKQKREHPLVLNGLEGGLHELSISWGDKMSNVDLGIEPDKSYYLEVDLFYDSKELTVIDDSLRSDGRWEILNVKDGVPNRVRDNLTGIVFLYVRGGTFNMGGNAASKMSGARPVHSVSVDDFYMAETEITQGQWLTLMNYNPSGIVGELFPVSGISFEECHSYFAKSGANMRLPTEAEWEYACRAGTKGRYSLNGKGTSIDDVAWHYDNSDGRMHRVGRKKPNGWGFYDMHGNVMEWCSDRYFNKYYEISPKNNPKGPNKLVMGVTGRSVRGGSWYHGTSGRGLASYDRHRVSSSVEQDNAIANGRGYVLFATNSFLGMRPVIPAPLF